MADRRSPPACGRRAMTGRWRWSPPRPICPISGRRFPRPISRTRPTTCCRSGRSPSTSRTPSTFASAPPSPPSTERTGRSFLPTARAFPSTDWRSPPARRLGCRRLPASTSPASIRCDMQSDARGLATALHAANDVVVVGGGFIGLEIAAHGASARQDGDGAGGRRPAHGPRRGAGDFGALPGAAPRLGQRYPPQDAGRPCRRRGRPRRRRRDRDRRPHCRRYRRHRHRRHPERRAGPRCRRHDRHGQDRRHCRRRLHAKPMCRRSWPPAIASVSINGN